MPKDSMQYDTDLSTRAALLGTPISCRVGRSTVVDNVIENTW